MKKIEIIMPQIDVNEETATITEIHVEEGKYIKQGDILISIETTKAVSDISAESSGYFLPLCKNFEVKNSGDIIAIIFEEEKDLIAFKQTINTELQAQTDIMARATKKAIALANELHVDIALVIKDKENGIVKEKDVEEFANRNHDHGESIKVSNKTFVLKRERVVIIGAGKGAEVVIDILLDYPDIEIVGLVDDNVKEMKNYGYPVLPCGLKDFPDKYGPDFYDSAVISIGANLNSMKFRRQIFEDYTQRGVKFTNAISKSAEIRRGVQIGKGNIIGSGCYIGTLAQIGDNNSIGYGTNIGHHNIVGSHNLVAPGVFTSGSDVIGDSCIIPAGVSIINRVTIGDEVIVPLGYAVTNNIESGKIIKK